MGSITDAVGGLFDSGVDAAGDAADAQVQAQRDNIDWQKEIFNAIQGLNSYGQGIGNQALGLQASFFGLSPGYNPAGSYSFNTGGGTPGGSPGSWFAGNPGQQPSSGNGLTYTPPGANPGAPAMNFGALMNTPDYQFTQSEGNRALGQAQAARGNLFSGGAAKELEQYNQGLASQQINNVWNRLSGLSGAGQVANQNTQNALQNAGQSVGNSLMGIGDARASGRLGAYQAQQQGLNNWLSIAGMASGAGMFGGGGQPPTDFASGINGAAGLFSDRRLKSNIRRIGTHASGLPWYSYEIFGEPAEGVMADEVLEVKPEAVGVHPSGFLVVNYGAL